MTFILRRLSILALLFTTSLAADVCSICNASDLVVGLPDVIISDGLVATTCQKAYERGLDGNISATSCPLVQQVAVEKCGCAEEIVSGGGKVAWSSLLAVVALLLPLL